MLDTHAIKQEARPMLALAGPVVLAELGWMAMGTVDTLMVGRLSPHAIGAVGIGHALFLVPAFFGVGLLLGLDTLVAQAFGARRHEDCHRALFHGVYLGLLLTPPLTAFGLWLVAPLLASADVDPAVLEHALPYLETVTWSLLPLLLYTALRRYLQAIGCVRPVMIALVSANLVNVGANWILIFGHLGAPALGVEGAAWATVLSRAYMAAFLLLAVIRHDRRHTTRLWRAPRRLDPSRLASLVRLGLPAALQITLEMGVFATATWLAGQLDAASLAAHQIAVTAASVTFMVPLGVSAAGAVRVGQAVGRRDRHGAAASGWTALLIGTGFMSLAGLAFLTVPEWVVRAFTSDHEVVATGATLLVVAAFFQLFDGIQVVTTGIMRGLGDTRTPMLANLAGHWLLGLPVGATLCFGAGLGVGGLWMGLCLGLIAVGAALLLAWTRQVRALQHSGTAQGAGASLGSSKDPAGLRKTTP
jgi:multidrug resistance protein, MATE family